MGQTASAEQAERCVYTVCLDIWRDTCVYVILYVYMKGEIKGKIKLIIVIQITTYDSSSGSSFGKPLFILSVFLVNW